MQELFDIITHKFRLISHKPTNLTNAQKDELLDELLVEKKKESLRNLVETRLQQSLDTKRITNHAELIHILQRTHQVMAIHDAQLPLPNREEPIQSIVELFSDFFTRQNCSLRAQEISNIYKKKLCPKGLLTTTLFNWLVEWVRKHFQQYLKTTIHSLYVDSRQPRQYKTTQKEEEQKAEPYLEHNYLLVKKHSPMTVHRSIISSSFRERRGMYSLELEERKAEEKKAYKIEKAQKEKVARERVEVEKVQRVRIKSQSPQYPSQYRLKLDEMETIEVEQSFPINRDIFYSAYAEEIQYFYKSIQPCIPDLDLAFAKRFRKGGRRGEIKRRVKQVAANLAKHMAIIRQSIEDYYQYYCNTHPFFTKKIKKARKAALDKTNKSLDTPSKTSHGVRSLSTEKMIQDRKKNIISSLSKKHRYVQLDQQQSNNQSKSNLLVQAKVQKTHAKTNKSHAGNRPIQFTFPDQGIYRQSKILVLNSGFISSQLQIIQQKAKKLKSKSHKPSKKSAHKEKQSKSIDLNEQAMDVAYSSLPVTISVTPSSHLRLPKIRRIK